MINKSKEECCGCGACAQVCPRDCIVMKEDQEGFLYPEVDKLKCVSCNLCEKSCPVILNKVSPQEPVAYAAFCKDEELRLQSSSGGIFSLLAEQILEQGGIVFGAAFDKDWSVHHIGIERVEDLEMLRGSKYLQSRTENTYLEVKKQLLLGRKVLYSGTPCEIEGLKAYLNGEYENLYTQDLICHGSPSPKVWKKYVDYRENCAGAAAQRTFFRHKKYGWKTYAVLFEFSNNTAYEQILTKDLFMQMFLQNLCLRPSCYKCAFKKLGRQSDITLADFWGADKVVPELDDNKGCSVVLIHSEKGKRLFEMVKSQMTYKKVELSDALLGNPSMTKSCEKTPKRDAFMQAVNSMSFDQLAKAYVKRSSLKAKIGKYIPENTKERIKKFLKMK